MQNRLRGLLSPRSGRTLQDLNTALKNRISDHSPIMVELPKASTPSGAQVARRRKGRSERCAYHYAGKKKNMIASIT